MDKDELLGFYAELLQQGNPFQHMGSKPIEEIEQSTTKRLSRAAIKGATFGLTNQNFQPEGIGEHVAEFVGSIPSTVGAVAATSAIPVVGPALATLGPTASRMARAGIVGTGIGGAKAVINQDPSALVTEPMWWLGGEAVGLGFGAIFRKLRGSGLSVKEATEQAEKQVLQQSTALARRPLGPEIGQEFTPATPVKLAPKKLIEPAVDAEDVVSVKGALTENTRSGYFEQKPIETQESSFFRSPEAYSSPQEMDDVTKLLQKNEAATQIDQMLEPKPSQQIHTPLREPLVFEKETGPFPRFVKEGGRFRTPDEFGNDLDLEFYGRPRRMDEFGLEDVDNLPDINTFSHGAFDDPRDKIKKLLTMDVDPQTGLKTYTPLDEHTNAIIDSTLLSPREIEPPLDRFKIKAVQSPKNVEKLDLIKENQNLTTSKLLELTDDELANIKDDFVVQPIKYFTVEDAPLATEAKKLITKMGFSQDEITEMEGMVDNMMSQIKNASINKNLPESEWQRARQQLWEDLLKKRMRPC